MGCSSLYYAQLLHFNTFYIFKVEVWLPADCLHGLWFAFQQWICTALLLNLWYPLPISNPLPNEYFIRLFYQTIDAQLFIVIELACAYFES